MLFEGSEGLVFPLLAVRRSKCMACFYEIRNSNNAVLKHHGGFATQDAAKIARRADGKKIKNSRTLLSPCIRLRLRWNSELLPQLNP